MSEGPALSVCTPTIGIGGDKVGWRDQFCYLGSGEGPDCHFPKEISVLGPFPARIRRETYFLLLFWPQVQLGLEAQA